LGITYTELAKQPAKWVNAMMGYKEMEAKANEHKNKRPKKK